MKVKASIYCNLGTISEGILRPSIFCLSHIYAHNSIHYIPYHTSLYVLCSSEKIKQNGDPSKKEENILAEGRYVIMI
jgi:hypothetical protein